MAIISVVIPVYKAEKCLYELYTRLKTSLEIVSEDFEIILVEDCGGDRSWEIIQELAKQDPRVKGIQFSRNFGQHYGITAGLDHCDGDWVVVMDCDLQDRPEEIPRLYEKAQEGYDVVLAKRKKRQHGFFKKLTSKAFYQVFNYLADLQYDAEVGNFRIISKQVVSDFLLMREQLRFFGGLVDWMGFPTASIEVKHDSRFEGKSTYTFKKLWKLAIDTIIAYSDKPLRLSIRVGFTISLLAFMGVIYIMTKSLLFGVSVTGWSSLIVSLYFLGGIIIANLGIIGIYLGKTFEQSKNRPLYLIRSQTSNLFKDDKKNKLTIFAMTEKGYAVLTRIIPSFKNNIETVISSRDLNMQKDFYLEIKSLCENNDINFVDKKDFKKIATEYAIAISWRWLINTDHSKLIVFHDSLLPRYRGFNPLVCALINGENQIGVTALFATSEYDRGDIITQSSTKIEYPIKIQDAIRKIIKNYEKVALCVMETIVNNERFTITTQNEQEATYSLWRDEEDYLINWDQSSIKIKRFIDAVGYPYKGAYTRLDANLVRILDVEIVEDVVIENRMPGKVIFTKNLMPIVVCGQGLLQIIEMVDDQHNKSLIPLPRFRMRFG